MYALLDELVGSKTCIKHCRQSEISKRKPLQVIFLIAQFARTNMEQHLHECLCVVCYINSYERTIRLFRECGIPKNQIHKTFQRNMAGYYSVRLFSSYQLLFIHDAARHSFFVFLKTVMASSKGTFHRQTWNGFGFGLFYLLTAVS